MWYHTFTEPTMTMSDDVFKMEPLGLEDLRATSLPETGKAFYKALAEHFIHLLNDPVFKAEAVDLLKKVIPGRILDGFADNLYEMVISVITLLLQKVLSK